MLHIAKNLEYGVTRIRNLSTPEQISTNKLFQQMYGGMRIVADTQLTKSAIFVK